MYKNVVTHYLASKMEIWMALFMNPVYGAESGNAAFEFAKTRGAIHYYLTSTLSHDAISTCHQFLRICAESISEAMEIVNL